MSAIMNTQEQLTHLPTKTGKPLIDLLARGLISEKAVQDILDASELSGNSSKLLAFAIGYQYLTAQGTPVSDTIRMAKELGLKVNMDWSQKRWKAEHNRYARALTLKKMTSHNHSYDLQVYEQELPLDFPGYLIRTSRRLGMEGLRQRHCVASYDNLIRNGSLAFVSLFINNKRWTVQLHLTKKPEAPLAITQIKTRYNGVPTAEERREIYSALNIQPIAIPISRTVNEERTYMDNLRRILPTLRQLNAGRITVTFDGCGDSGSIDSVNCDVDIDLESTQVIIQTSRNVWSENGWHRESSNSAVNLDQAIIEITEDYLEFTGVDWYNNDGGFGELGIDVQAGTVELDVNSRFTDSELEFSMHRDILTGDEL